VVRRSRRTSTRGDAAVAFGPELPRSGLVPPVSFFPTSTVCSAWYLAGLLRPAADHGVRHVSGPGTCTSSGSARSRQPPGRRRFPREDRCRPDRVPAFPVAPEGFRSGLATGGRAHDRAFPGGAVPFEAFPSPAAVPRHRDLCPLAVGLASVGTSVAFPQGKCTLVRLVAVVDLRALLRWRVRCVGARFRHVDARCSHGLRSHVRVGLPLRPPALPAHLYRSASGLAAVALLSPRPRPSRCDLPGENAQQDRGGAKGCAGLTAFTLDPACRAHGPDQVPASQGKCCPRRALERTVVGLRRHHVQQSAAEGRPRVLFSSGSRERCNPGDCVVLLAGRANEGAVLSSAVRGSGRRPTRDARVLQPAQGRAPLPWASPPRRAYPALRGRIDAVGATVAGSMAGSSRRSVRLPWVACSGLLPSTLVGAPGRRRPTTASPGSRVAGSGPSSLGPGSDRRIPEVALAWTAGAAGGPAFTGRGDPVGVSRCPRRGDESPLSRAGRKTGRCPGSLALRLRSRPASRSASAARCAWLARGAGSCGSRKVGFRWTVGQAS
jgi:hypothetical protein